MKLYESEIQRSSRPLKFSGLTALVVLAPLLNEHGPNQRLTKRSKKLEEERGLQ